MKIIIILFGRIIMRTTKADRYGRPAMVSRFRIPPPVFVCLADDFDAVLVLARGPDNPVLPKPEDKDVIADTLLDGAAAWPAVDMIVDCCEGVSLAVRSTASPGDDTAADPLEADCPFEGHKLGARPLILLEVCSSGRIDPSIARACSTLKIWAGDEFEPLEVRTLSMLDSWSVKPLVARGFSTSETCPEDNLGSLGARAPSMLDACSGDKVDPLEARALLISDIRSDDGFDPLEAKASPILDT